MAILFNCPHCRARVSVGDECAGMQGQCPGCGRIIPIPTPANPGKEGILEALPVPPPGTVPPGGAVPSPGPAMPPRAAIPPVASREPGATKEHGAAQPPPVPRARRDDDWNRDWNDDRRREDDWDDEPPRRRRLWETSSLPAGDWSPPWNTVRIGLTLIRGGIATVFLGALAFAIVLVFYWTFEPHGGFRNEPVAYRVLMFAAVGVVVVGGLLALIGQSLCCAAPADSGARGLAVSSIICQGVYLLLTVLAVILLIAVESGRRRNQEGEHILVGMVALTALAVYTAAHVLFVLFLRSAARYFGKESTSRSAVSYLIYFGILAGVSIVGLCLIFMATEAVRGGPRPMNEAMAMLLAVFSFALFVGHVVRLVWYLILVYYTRNAIPRGPES